MPAAYIQNKKGEKNWTNGDHKNDATVADLENLGSVFRVELLIHLPGYLLFYGAVLPTLYLY